MGDLHLTKLFIYLYLFFENFMHVLKVSWSPTHKFYLQCGFLIFELFVYIKIWRGCMCVCVCSHERNLAFWFLLRIWVFIDGTDLHNSVAADPCAADVFSCVLTLPTSPTISYCFTLGSDEAIQTPHLLLSDTWLCSPYKRGRKGGQSKSIWWGM